MVDTLLFLMVRLRNDQTKALYIHPPNQISITFGNIPQKSINLCCLRSACFTLCCRVWHSKWLQLQALNVDISVHSTLFIRRLGLAPFLHRLLKGLLVVLSAKVERLLFLAYGADSRQVSSAVTSNSMPSQS